MNIIAIREGFLEKCAQQGIMTKEAQGMWERAKKWLSGLTPKQTALLGGGVGAGLGGLGGLILNPYENRAKSFLAGALPGGIFGLGGSLLAKKYHDWKGAQKPARPTSERPAPLDRPKKTKSIPSTTARSGRAYDAHKSEKSPTTARSGRAYDAYKSEKRVSPTAQETQKRMSSKELKKRLFEQEIAEPKVKETLSEMHKSLLEKKHPLYEMVKGVINTPEGAKPSVFKKPLTGKRLAEAKKLREAYKERLAKTLEPTPWEMKMPETQLQQYYQRVMGRLPQTFESLEKDPSLYLDKYRKQLQHMIALREAARRRLSYAFGGGSFPGHRGFFQDMPPGSIIP